MSGVYIPGMEMPKSCATCRFGDCVICYITNERLSEEWDSKRCSLCPLVPVPDHGRLIDADEFYKDINESVLLTEGFKDTFNLWFDEQPTIIPADKEKDG